MAQKATLAYLNGIEVAPGSLFLGDLSMAFNTYEESLQPVTDLLVLRLDCTETTSYPGSGDKWYDISGNANTGSLTGSISFASSSLVWNSSNFSASVFVPHASNYSVFDGAFTIDMWITIDAFVSTPVNDVVGTFYKGANVGAISSIGARTDRNTNAANFGKGYWTVGYTGNADRSIPSFGFFTEDGAYIAKKWYNIQLTRAVDGTVNSYSNGTLIQSGSGFTQNYNSTSGLTLGKYGPSYGGWQGKIGTFLVYDKALSTSELTQNYNYYKTKFI